MFDALKIREYPARIFCVYENVFRDHNFFLLKKIMEDSNLRRQLEDFIDLSRFEQQCDARIQALLLHRHEQNILKWLATRKFDYDYNYKALHEHWLMMYEESPKLVFFEAFQKMLQEDFLKELFIYSKEFDKRIAHDIVKNLGHKDKVVYVTGQYMSVIERIGEINMFIDHDVSRISPILRMPEKTVNSFLIAQYGYNYEWVNGKQLPQLKDDVTGYANRNHMTVAEFVPFKLTLECMADG